MGHVVNQARLGELVGPAQVGECWVGCHVGGRAIATSTANQARLSEAVASAGYCMLGSATICWVDGATSLFDPSWLSDLEVCRTAEDLHTDVTGSFLFTLVR